MNHETLRAGVARRSITPPKGIYQIGYGDRTKGNIGVHDDLTATALVLDDGSTRLAVVALDMLTINEYVVDRVHARLAATEVLLCCSHTHSGPIAYADGKSSRRNRAYIDLLVERIVDAVQEALSNLQPAHLEYSLGEGSVGINRRERLPDGRMEIGRNPDGPRDKSLQVLSVMSDAGRLATIVNYACHGTVLGPDNLLISADWIGVMRQQVETKLGGLALFLQGATANINPDMYWGDSQVFEKVAEQGLRVAESVLAAVRSGSERIQATPIRVDRSQAWMPTETQATSPRPPKNYTKPLLDMAHLPGFMAVFADLLLDQRYPWKPTIEAKQGYWSVPMRISAVKLGDLALVAFGAETFTEIGMKVKAASPAKHTFFASITDGSISYLHTAEAHTEGGYEVNVAPLAYRYPGRFQARCEQIALDASQDMLERLWK